MNHTSHRTLSNILNPKKTSWFERNKSDVYSFIISVICVCFIFLVLIPWMSR